MKILACPVCGNIFKDSFKGNMYIPTNECPIKSCSGKIDEFDQTTFEIVHVLEQKGYHLISIYISGSFESIHDIRLHFRDYYSFPSLPTGFELKSYKPKFVVHPIDVVKYLDDSLPRTELYKQLAQSCIDLMTWAESLPG